MLRLPLLPVGLKAVPDRCHKVAAFRGNTEVSLAIGINGFCGALQRWCLFNEADQRQPRRQVWVDGTSAAVVDLKQRVDVGLTKIRGGNHV